MRLASSAAIAAVGILRDRGLAVVHAAGVRRAHAPSGRRRARTTRPRPCRAAADGAARAIRHRLAVGRVRHVEEHDLALRVGGALLELLEVLDDEHVGLDALGRRRHAAAEAQHRDRDVRADRRSRRSPAPAPSCGTITFSARTLARPSFFIVASAQRMARLQVLGARQAVAVGVGQLGQATPREVVGLRRAISLAAGIAVRREPGGGRGLRGADGAAAGGSLEDTAERR